MNALEQLNLAAPITDTYTAVESMIIAKIAEQIAGNPQGLINNSSQWRIQMLARMGRFTKDTAKIISSRTKGIGRDIENAINSAAEAVVRENGLEMTGRLAENIRSALSNYDRQAIRGKYNQVNTVMQYKAKQAYLNSVNGVASRFERIQQKELDNKQEHLDVLNRNAMAAALGERSRTEALRATIEKMSDKGIPAFIDKAGREWSPETYVNMDIRNTVKNAANAAQFASIEELGQDVVLVSSHAGARPLCAPYQGKLYSLSGKSGTIRDLHGKEYHFEPWSSTSYGKPAGLLGINCGHTIRGVSDGAFVNREKQYSEKENSEEYEKVVKQRELERSVRKLKTKRNALQAAGDTEGVKEYNKRIKAANQRLQEYCDTNGLYNRRDRTEVYGYVGKKIKPDDTQSQFREVLLDKINPTTIQRGRNITTYRVTNANNQIYVSSNAHIKPKKMHKIDMKVSEVYEMMGLSGAENKPEIFIITGDEMAKTAVAVYQPVQNRLLINENIALYKKEEAPEILSIFACYKDDRSSYVHELYHWKDAEEYRKENGDITSANYSDYEEWVNRKSKKTLDKVVKRGYNISDLSEYGRECFDIEDFAEAHTEYRTQIALRGGKV